MSLQVPKVLNYFRDVILRRDMDKDSALLLNAGAHYVKVFSLIIFARYFYMKLGYLTIIPRARLGSESIAAEWAIDSEAMRTRGIIVLVKSIKLKLVKNVEDKNILASLS